MYLMGGAHEDVVGDFSKHQSQVDDIILCAAAFRKVADVNNSACRGFSGRKWLQMIMRKNQKKFFKIEHLKTVTVRPSYHCTCTRVHPVYTARDTFVLLFCSA